MTTQKPLQRIPALLVDLQRQSTLLCLLLTLDVGIQS